MVPTTDPVRHNTVREFYDSLSADYDLMTDFPLRFIRERPFFHMLIDKFHIRTALDAGAGTGFHSIMLAQLGVKVTAVDLSPRMITFVKAHAARRGLTLKALVGNFAAIPVLSPGPFDAVFSLGNSLAHASSHEELLSWLRSFATVLRPGGILFVQNLNFDRILAERQKLLGVREAGDKKFIRSYDYEGDRVIFNIRTSERVNGRVEERRSAIPLLPLLRTDIVKVMESAGFDDVRTFGGISMNTFVPATSTDLVILGKVKNPENKKS